MAEKVLAKAESFFDIYDRNPSPSKDVTHYCPGCGHGVLHKLIAEAIDDFGIRERTVLFSPVGCSVFAYYYFRTGNIQCAHGRAPAAATGFKRTHPESIVISYQGDGDLAAIGTAEIIQAANRGENFTVFFVNNAIYGMTGGQLAPTTLVGQKTTTSPYGRNPANEGYPIKVAEMISTLDAPVYVERVAITDAKNTARVRRAVRKGLQNQIDNKGFSLIEVLSVCPSNWKMDPIQSKQWLSDNMIQQFPLGIFRDRTGEVPAAENKRHIFHVDGLREALELPVETESTIKVAAPAPEFQDPRIKLAGFGGQGVLMLGLMLAEAGMHAGYHVSWIPSYGPEMRGGTANCHVNLSHRRIGSPTVSRPTLLVAMNLPSLERFENEVVPGGLIIYDTAMVTRAPKRTDVKALGIPASTIADELGNTRGANMVILGAYIGYTSILPKEAIFAAMPSLIKRKNLIPLNEQAVEKGMEFVRNLRG
ncbi:MAG TPA: 2-oxoacid:acceptor oxidoreductase family protein [bacterium]|nr:2-oxoacid:acceptor oxidoreductase family protein [bacterium]HOH06658.1 2-oxoacid:acceptor oxidoreductase family protein [bacterium]HOY45404.1 2-oxoacid:acceptor oxidoreductase family protein [bacterium]HPG84453.1 2-oxoacid:acceptor oxidoreductase family protein [bacterium]HPM59766.1 2-oxoacid:acceptor oxidoreductase family protein [bacterium]